MTTSLPASWSIRPLGELARVYSGGTPLRSVPAFWNGSIPWVTTTEIDFGTIRSARQTITESGLKSSAAKIAPPGTLLIAMYGQGKTRGKTAILGIPAAMNQACAAVEVHSDLSSAYLLHYLASQYDAIRALSNSGGQENLSGEIVKKIPVVVPNRPEQERIATVLQGADDLIEAIVRAVSKIEALGHGMAQALLTGRKRFEGFGGSWSEVVLGEHTAGFRGAGLNKESLTASGAHPCILYGELFTTYGRRIDRVLSRTDVGRGVWSQAGDVLVPGSTTTVARDLATASALHASGVLLGGDTNVLRPGPLVDPDWLAYYVTHRLGDRIAEVAQGTTIKHLYVRDLVSSRVQLPSLEEQRAIVGALLAVEAQRSVLRERLRKMREVRRGMMQQLLTGRTRLPDAEVPA